MSLFEPAMHGGITRETLGRDSQLVPVEKIWWCCPRRLSRVPGCDRGLGSILERQFPPLFSTPSGGMEGLVGHCVSAATRGEYLRHFYEGDQAEPKELSPAG